MGGLRATSAGFRVSKREVDGLILQADEHPLGRRFLLDGALNSVAATFHVHAFVVDAARRRLGPQAGVCVEVGSYSTPPASMRL